MMELKIEQAVKEAKIETKIFGEVFKKIQFSQSVSRKLNNAVVEYIKVNAMAKKMEVALEKDMIVDERVIFLLCDDLKREFPFIESVHAKVRYATKEQEPTEIVKKFWNNILYA